LGGLEGLPDGLSVVCDAVARGTEVSDVDACERRPDAGNRHAATVENGNEAGKHPCSVERDNAHSATPRH
jgi:hypothetical protein